MSDQKLLDIKKNYKKRGTILVSEDNKLNPINKKDFIELKNYCEKVKKEFIQIGDAGEKNHLMVGRFMTDVKKPEIVKNRYSKKVISILKKKKFLILLKQLLEQKRLYM